MRRLPVLLLIVLCLAAVAGCGGSGDEPAGEQAQTGTTAEQAASGCEKATEPEPREVEQREAPSFRVAKDKTYTAVLETSCGTLEIELDAERAPKTASSFIALVREGFYDGLLFHRIAPGFVVQGGDPEGTGMGDPGYQVVEEPPSDLRYDRGVVAMAKAGNDPPGASGSQFFVVTAEQTDLPPEYALLGRLTGGEDALDRLSQVATDPTQDRPIDPVVIEKATIRES